MLKLSDSLLVFSPSKCSVSTVQNPLQELHFSSYPCGMCVVFSYSVKGELDFFVLIILLYSLLILPHAGWPMLQTPGTIQNPPSRRITL